MQAEAGRIGASEAWGYRKKVFQPKTKPEQTYLSREVLACFKELQGGQSNEKEWAGEGEIWGWESMVSTVLKIPTRLW